MRAVCLIFLVLVGFSIQAAEPTKIPNLRADICRTPWTWVNSSTVDFEPGGRATVGADKATDYKWKVKSAEQRIVEVTWTYAGNKRNVVFTFAEDMKSAKAIMDGKREWDSKPVAK